MFIRIMSAAIAVCGLCSGSAHAHKINPLQNKYRQDSQTVLRKVSEPVHEEITQLARACRLAHPGPVQAPLICEDRSTLSTEARGNKYDSLIRGVWWNDDPNQLLFAARQAKWLAWMRDAHGIATNGENWKGRKAAIGPDYNMTYRSHYGDLQFLHAMASRDGETAAATQQGILLWAEFAFLTATGRLDLETTMNRVMPVGLQPYFQQQSGWTVNYLFAPKYQLKGVQHKYAMATGSLLHLVQDSYSAAHVQRAFDASERCPLGRIVQFHSYSHQDPDLHAAADLRSAWQERQFTAAQDPVNVSATLLAYIDQNADWNTVRDYLEDTVFCVDSDAVDAGPGEFAPATMAGGAP